MRQRTIDVLWQLNFFSLLDLVYFYLVLLKQISSLQLIHSINIMVSNKLVLLYWSYFSLNLYITYFNKLTRFYIHHHCLSSILWNWYFITINYVFIKLVECTTTNSSMICLERYKNNITHEHNRLWIVIKKNV